MHFNMQQKMPSPQCVKVFFHIIMRVHRIFVKEVDHRLCHRIFSHDCTSQFDAEGGSVGFSIHMRLAISITCGFTSEAHQCVITMESQLRSSWSSSSLCKRFPNLSSTEQSSATVTKTAAARIPNIRLTPTTYSITNSNPTRTNALHCFMCREPDHRQTTCPNQSIRRLVLYEVFS